jgi:peptidyl-prolyl cis-trans isomerase C
MKIRVVLASFTVLTLACRSFAADKPTVTAASTNKAASAAASASTGDETVARVNGTEVKRKELETAVQAYAMQLARQGRSVSPTQTAALEHEVLDDLIGRELLLQEGTKHLPADLDKQVQEQVDKTKTQLGGDDGYKKTLADTGITPEEYSHRVRDNLIIRQTIQSVVDKEVKVSPEEIKAFYTDNPDQFKQPELVHASHILIRCAPDATDEVKKQKRTQIEAARALVKGGEKFADVAKKVSEDPGSAAKGGDLGFFPRGRMVPEFDIAAFSLKTNEVSDVITTQFGYHILLVIERKPAQTVPFDEVKDELGQYLKQRKSNESARNHVAELRKTAKVDVLLPALPSAPVVSTPPIQAPPAPAKTPAK